MTCSFLPVTYDVISNGSGWRTDVVNQYLEFGWSVQSLFLAITIGVNLPGYGL